MATSGSVDFTISRNDILNSALTLCGYLDPDATASGNDYTNSARMLNLMVKAWMSKGINLWAMKEATLFLAEGTAAYSLGPSGTHCTNTYVQTTLSTDEATSSTSIGLTAFAGMSASDNIGIVLDDGSIHWTTISGAPGATTTIATGLASAATSGNVVFTYTAKINRPQRIISAYRRSISGQDTPIELIARGDYADLSNKSTTGKPIQAFFDPQLTAGSLYLWPTPDLTTDVVRFWYSRPLEDFDAATDNPDFPIEWGEALIYGLAERLCDFYRAPIATKQMLKAEAMEKLYEAQSYDREPVSVFFGADVR
jgi:hypothetical protein